MAKELDKKEIEELRKLIKFLEKDISDVDFNNLIKSETSAKTLLESLRKEADSFVSDIGKASEGFRNIVNNIKKTNTSALDVAKSFDKLSNIAEQIKFHQNGINILSVKEIEGLKTKAQIENERLKASESGLLRRKLELGSELDILNLKKSTSKLTDEEQRERRKLNKEYEKTKSALDNIKSVIKDNNDLYNGLVVTLDKASNKLEEQEKLSKNLLGLGGAAITGVSTALQKLGFGGLASQLGIDEAKDKMKTLADQIIADKEKEESLAQSVNQLATENSKISIQLIEKEKELLGVKEKITLIDSLTQQREELNFEKELLDAKKNSIGLTQEEKKERTKLNKEIKSIETSLKGLGSIKSAIEVETILQKQIESTKERKEEIKTILELEKEELKTISKSNKEMEGIGGKIAVLKTGISSMKDSLIKNLTDPLAIASSVAGLIVVGFKKIIEAGFKANKNITDLGKSMATSSDRAREVRNRFIEIERGTVKFKDSLDTSLVTVEKLIKGQFELAEAFGATRGFTEQQVRDQIYLTEQIGLSTEAAAGLQQLAMANGKTADGVVGSIIKQTSSLAKQTGIQLDNRKILGEVAKVSGQLRLQYQNNPELIAKAVIQTQKLGITLEQAANSARKLLDFESSIENELAAELITGRDLNLERARLLALNGDVAGSMQEMLGQIGSASDFMGMNVIQQESLAKAVGMTADELANSLVQQENLNRLGSTTRKQIEDRVNELKKEGKTEEANKLMRSLGNEEEAKTALEKIDAQTKFNNLIEKLQSILGNIASGPMEEIIDQISTWLSTSGNIEKLTEKIKYVADGVKTVFDGVLTVAKFIKDNFEIIVALIGIKMVAGLVSAIAKARTLALTLSASGGGGAGGMLKGVGGVAGVASIAGIAAMAGSSALDSTSSKKVEKEIQLRQEATLATSAEEKKKKLELAEKEKSSREKIDIASGGLKGAAAGLGIATVLGGLGAGLSATGIGAIVGIPLLLGAAYAASQRGEKNKEIKSAAASKAEEIQQNTLNNAESFEDFIWRPGQRPIRFRKDDVIAGGTDIDKNLKSKSTSILTSSLSTPPTTPPKTSIPSNLSPSPSPTVLVAPISQDKINQTAPSIAPNFNTKTPQPINNNIDITLLANELKEIKSVLKDNLIVNKETSISIKESSKKELNLNMDSTTFGTAVNVSTYKIQ